MNLRSMIDRCNLRTKFVLPISVILVCSILVVSAYLIQRQDYTLMVSILSTLFV